MAGVKGMKGGGGARPGAGRKPNSCQVCIYWTVDTPEQSKKAGDPPDWWGMCSQLRLQTEADFYCNKFFRNHQEAAR